MGSEKKKNITFPVQSADELLPFLMQALNGKSRTSVKSLLAHRQVYVNGAVQTRHDTPLKPGDSVMIMSGKGNVELRHPKLRLVYEDEYLLVVEKKQGLLTVPARVGSQELTVMSILKAYVRKQNPRNNVYVVHRLDRETSGLLVFAKSVQLQEYMRSYWKELVTERTYVALAEGIFEKNADTITTWLTEDKRNAVVYSSPVDDGGDKAVTHYKVIKDNRDTEDEPKMSLDYSQPRGGGQDSCAFGIHRTSCSRRPKVWTWERFQPDRPTLFARQSVGVHSPCYRAKNTV